MDDNIVTHIKGPHYHHNLNPDVNPYLKLPKFEYVAYVFNMDGGTNMAYVDLYAGTFNSTNHLIVGQGNCFIWLVDLKYKDAKSSFIIQIEMQTYTW